MPPRCAPAPCRLAALTLELLPTRPLLPCSYYYSSESGYPFYYAVTDEVRCGTLVWPPLSCCGIVTRAAAVAAAAALALLFSHPAV